MQSLYTIGQVLLIFLFLGGSSVSAQTQAAPATALLGYEVRLYEHSPAWDLAQAVRFHHPRRIHRLLSVAPTLASYQDPQLSQSLLMFAIIRHNYGAAKALLASGANPNQDYNLAGDTPLIEAARIPNTSKFVRLLLAYGAAPNQESRTPDNGGPVTTPLTEAASTRLETVQVLLAQGANINQVTARGSRSALLGALLSEDLDMLRYLLMTKQADYTIGFGVTVQGDTLHIAQLLKHIVCPLESKRYQQKMAIVHYLESQGVKYREAAVPTRFYQKYSKAFLDSY
jgi:ankyrin repeat protein